MEQVMYDVYIAEATMENDYQNFNAPEKKEIYINDVFVANGINQMQWDTSLSWYSDKIDLYLKMNDSVKARIKRAQTALNSRITEQREMRIHTNEKIYSASYIPTYYHFLIPDRYNGGFRFRFDSTNIANDFADDDLSFNFKVIGFPQKAYFDLSSMLTLVYGDTTIYRQEKINENRKYSIPILKFITNDTLRQIHGFVKLHNHFTVSPIIQLYDMSLGNSAEEEPGSTLIEVPTKRVPEPQTIDSIMVE